MLVVRPPQPPSIDPPGTPEGHSISLSVGPFRDQGELLRFALLLETAPGIGDIELIDAQTASALFVVRGPSAAEVAVLLATLPDYTVTATAVGNLVSARVQDPHGPAALLTPPPAPVAPRASSTPPDGEPVIIEQAEPRWWRRAALAVALGSGAAGILLATLNGLPWQTPAAPPARSASTPIARTPTASPAVATPTTPLFSALPVETPMPGASASATPGTSSGPSGATGTPAPAATTATAVTSRYSGAFSGALGSIRSLNGCVWDTPLDGTITMSLTRASDGSVSGRANLTGTISLLVSETPEGGTCEASSVSMDASGTATGGSSVRASLSGPRDLVVTFNGTPRGDTMVGDLTVQRLLSTASTFGSTTETRSTTITGITLSR